MIWYAFSSTLFGISHYSDQGHNHCYTGPTGFSHWVSLDSHVKILHSESTKISYILSTRKKSNDNKTSAVARGSVGSFNFGHLQQGASIHIWRLFLYWNALPFVPNRHSLSDVTNRHYYTFYMRLFMYLQGLLDVLDDTTGGTLWYYHTTIQG